jgi:hypothetical protein
MFILIIQKCGEKVVKKKMKFYFTIFVFTRSIVRTDHAKSISEVGKLN